MYIMPDFGFGFILFTIIICFFIVRAERKSEKRRIEQIKSSPLFQEYKQYMSQMTQYINNKVTHKQPDGINAECFKFAIDNDILTDTDIKRQVYEQIINDNPNDAWILGKYSYKID